MPTNEELKKLANYVYKVGDSYYTTPLEEGWTGVGQAHNVANFALDMDAMEKYNLKSAWNGSYLSLWSGTQYAGNRSGAWLLHLYADRVNYGNSYRYYTLRYAVCLGDTSRGE